MAAFSRSSFIPNRITLSPECIKDPLVLQLKVINNNMRKIDAYVVLGLKGKRKLQDEERRKDAADQRRRKQNALESQKKANPFRFIKDSLPKTGFLDAIRNFILYTAMGMMVPFVLKNLPTILGAVKALVPVYKFLEGFFGNVLGGVVSAIDFGYKVHDKIRGVLKTITGGKFEKTFDELSQNLNTFLNLAVVVGLAAAGSGATQILKPGTQQPQPSPTTSTQAPRSRTARRMRSPAAPRTGGRAIGKFGRVFGRVPIVGGLISFALSLMMGEKIGRAAAKAVGFSLGTALGGFIPIPIAGPILGGILGDIVGGGLYDTIASFGKPTKLATGGQVGRKKGRTSRSIRRIKVPRPPKQIRQRTVPGKNVGGEDAIRKIFPESENEQMASPLRLLKRNAAVMKRGGILGSLLSSGVELMALGQKVERSTLMGLEKYLAYVIDSSINDQATLNTRMLANSMFAMAAGGTVPVGRTIGQNGTSTGNLVAKEIVRSFTAMLNNRSVEIFQNIRRQMELQAPSDGKVIGEAGEGGLQVTSSSPDFWLLATAALFENNNPQSGYQGAADVAQAIYNRVSLPGWPKTIRDVILQKDQFQPVRDYGGYGAWSNIKDKQSAIEFVKKFGHSQDELEAVSAAILDTSRQNSARTFVGARDNFRSVSYENANNHLDDNTEQKRFGHVFGFEHKGANIAAFKAGKLAPAMINQQIVTGSVSYSEPYAGATGRYKPASPGYFNAIEYITGDKTYRPANYDASHGGDNYHDHIAFRTVQDKERAKAALRAADIKLGSETTGKHADSSYHYKNLAIDIPGGQWGGRGAIGPKEYAGSAKVRRVLGIDGSFNPRSIPTQADLTSPIIKPPGGGQSRPTFTPSKLKPLSPQVPTVKVIESFSITKNGKKYVLTRKRVNNVDVYTVNGRTITEDEYWKIHDASSTSSIFGGATSMISSVSPQLERNIVLTNRVTMDDPSSAPQTKIIMQPVLV